MTFHSRCGVQSMVLSDGYTQEQEAVNALGEKKCSNYMA